MATCTKLVGDPSSVSFFPSTSYHIFEVRSVFFIRWFYILLNMFTCVLKMQRSWAHFIIYENNFHCDERVLGSREMENQVNSIDPALCYSIYNIRRNGPCVFITKIRIHWWMTRIRVSSPKSHRNKNLLQDEIRAGHPCS